MKKGLVLVQNKDERSICRQALAGSVVAEMPNNLSDGLAEITRSKGALELVLLDERLDNATDSRNEGHKILHLLQKFNSSESRPEQSVVMVILNESTTLESPIAYSESGVDLFLRRPYGLKELPEKIAEAVRWIDSPPPVIKLMRYLNTALKQGKYDEVINGLTPLFEKNPKNIRMGMLLSRALIAKGHETRQKGLALVKLFDRIYPESLFSKRLLVEGYLLENQQLEAVQYARRIYELDPTEESFSTLFDLGRKALAEPTRDPGPLFAALETLATQPAVRVKAQKRAVLVELAAAGPTPSEWARLMMYVKAPEQEALLPEVKDLVESWMTAIAAIPDVDTDPLLQNLRLQSLQLLLDIDPGQPAAIEAHTNLQIARKNFADADKYLRAARDKHRFSVELYSSVAKLSLEDGHLKDASDAIHAGRRLAPSDDRWETLSKIWTEKYQASQAAPPAGGGTEKP